VFLLPVYCLSRPWIEHELIGSGRPTTCSLATQVRFPFFPTAYARPV
jgi:hypothetical protein